MAIAQGDRDGREMGGVQETTPLLAREEPRASSAKRGKNVLYRALLCAFMVSLSFGVTQVPILYVFRLMTCEAYYDHHPSPDPAIAFDRCGIRTIEAATARAISLMGASTTIFGLVNLLVTGWSIKKWGVKAALAVQVFFPAVRLTIQNIGVMTGGNAGIIIMLSSQVITIVGGPNGYVLALNSFVTDVVGHEERTGALGRLQGCMMVGSAVGFLVGGLVGDAFGIEAPFRMTLILFLLCCVYVVTSLPYIAPPPPTASAETTEKPGLTRFFGPLRVFAPQRWTLPSGRTSRQFGALALGTGVFLAILATGYLSTLLQMYATDEFGFGTSANGWLIFIYSSLRGLFLSIIFPRIISKGRKWLQPKNGSENAKIVEVPAQRDEVEPSELDLADTMDAETEPLAPPPRETERQTFAFDLLYARCSLLADAILTGCATFVTQGWQLYIVAVVLPLAAGTGAASKGTILQMLPDSERVDALSGITLVENIARLSTTAVFGLVFAALAEVGKTYLLFACNAGVALLGFCVLMLSRFPPEGSTRAEN